VANDGRKQMGRGGEGYERRGIEVHTPLPEIRKVENDERVI
jgi:hypothetical protein